MIDRSVRRTGLSLAVLLVFVAGPVAAEKRILVASQEAFHQAVKTVKAGDTIILRNGVWRDFDVVFTGEGTTDKPITLMAETQGSVVLSGQSHLRLGGRHLLVSGLVFRDGHTPTGEVVSFRHTQKRLAHDSRVTEVVIDNYNNPERFESDIWVAMYGRNNRFDHSHLVGKRNKGVTLAVRLDSADSRQNNHKIDHNYFGPRPILGANGGETLRIGTSHYSLSSSNTVVENNYFERTNGELEIVSVKSGGNVIRNNVFFEARGTLTLRHGNDNLVEGNVFFGNGREHTGGIRVINANQTVRHNYMEGLKGAGLGGALVVMNGVPNSPAHRYHQVRHALIEHNSIINSDHIQLGAGRDAERTAAPIDSHFRRNLVFSAAGDDVFTLSDDISGIDFSRNLRNRVRGAAIDKGFENATVELARAASGLLLPVASDHYGFGVRRDLMPVTREQTGVTWYEKRQQNIRFDHGREIEVTPGPHSLARAVADAHPGDILRLAAGEYPVDRILRLTVPLTIRSQTSAAANLGESEVHLSHSRSTLFEIAEGGSLKLYGLTVSGKDAPDSDGNSVIRTARNSLLTNYELIVDRCNFTELNKNKSYNFLAVARGTFADRIEITDSGFSDITGAVLPLDQESDDLGRYNAEYVTITGSSFDNIEGAAVLLYRGGSDESTFGPHFTLTSSRFSTVGHGSHNKTAASVFLQGAQVATVEDNIFEQSQPVRVTHTVGAPTTVIRGNVHHDTRGATIVELKNLPETSATEIGPREITE